MDQERRIEDVQLLNKMITCLEQKGTRFKCKKEIDQFAKKIYIFEEDSNFEDRNFQTLQEETTLEKMIEKIDKNIQTGTQKFKEVSKKYFGK